MEYSEKVLELFKNPVNAGKIKDADIIDEIENPECGDLVKLYIKIGDNSDGEKTIEDIKFLARGCPAAIACASALTIMAKGKTLDEALTIDRNKVADYLGGLPESKMMCSNIAPDLLHIALKKYMKEHGLKGGSSPEEEVLSLQKDVRGFDSVIDLTGKICPMTFVYTKVALEKLREGQILKVILDYPPAFENVPNSVKKQNLGDIIDAFMEGIKFILIIRRREDNG